MVSSSCTADPFMFMLSESVNRACRTKLPQVVDPVASMSNASVMKYLTIGADGLVRPV